MQIVLKLFPLRRLERREHLQDWAIESFEHIEKMLWRTIAEVEAAIELASEPNSSVRLCARFTGRDCDEPKVAEPAQKDSDDCLSCP